MSPESQQDHDSVRAAEWGAIVLLVGLALMLASSFWGQATDDAYITYRYAQKWMETGEFRFNDDISYGITAPGYAMLLATVASLGAPLGLDVPGSGSLLSLLCLFYLTGLLWRFTRRSASTSVRLLPLVVGVVLLTMPLVLGMWGSENMVAASLITSSALLLFEKDRPALAGFAAFLGIVIRMDAAVGALIIGLVALVRNRRVPWAYGLAGVLPLVVWLPFLQSHFGSVIPATLEAKRLIVTATYPSYTAQEWSYLRWALSETACWNILGLALIGLGTTLRRVGSRWPIVVSLGLWSLSQEILYRQLGIPCGAWYHLVSLASLLVMAGLGAVAVGLFVERLLPQGAVRRACAALAVVAALGPFWGSAFGRLRDNWQVPLDDRHRIYRQLGEYLNENSEPDDVIAMVEIGITAYFADRPVLDLCGLVSPAVVAASQAGRLAEYVREQRPEFIVDNPRFYGRNGYKSVLAKSDLRMTHVLVREFDTPEYEKGPIRLWKRVH